ncbi:hypothetical protein N7533_011222, partial [Penicillium manginii]|uniref:uncharacterized protein n=1 Tax=Penicillium manginii TaxID=203109 RepID=UPI002547A07C
MAADEDLSPTETLEVKICGAFKAEELAQGAPWDELCILGNNSWGRKRGLRASRQWQRIPCTD